MNGSTSGVTSDQRHKRANPCPICGGGENMDRGQSARCDGYSSSDGKWAFCSREERGGDACADGRLFRHLLRDEPRQQKSKIVATYDYRDEANALLYQVVRLEPKSFFQRAPDGAGGWITKLNGVRRVPYCLPELVADDGDRPVYLAEGEKDVDALRARGHTATCNAGGAGKWASVDDVAKKVLAGRDVIVVADNDKPGIDHAHDVLRRLTTSVASIKILMCPGGHKDVSDLFAAGGDVSQLVQPEQPDAEPEPAEEPTTGWHIWTADEIYAPLPPIDWIVEGIIPKGSVGLIVAYGSSLKSWAELDLIDAIPTGRKWLGRFPCKPGAALMIDFEAGSYEVRRRLQRIARGGGLERNDGVRFISFPPSFLNDEAFFVELLKLAADYVVITIDTLSAGSPGVDENDARFAVPLYKLKKVAEATGCAFVVLHHTRKSKDGEDDRETTRGTSAIFNALDFELKLFRSKDNEESFVCKQTKARGSKKVEPFVITVVDTGIDASQVLAADIDSLGDEESELTERVGGIEGAKRKILILLGTQHDIRSGNELHRRLKGTKKTNLDALEELKERGLVHLANGCLRLKSEAA